MCFFFAGLPFKVWERNQKTEEAEKNSARPERQNKAGKEGFQPAGPVGKIFVIFYTNQKNKDIRGTEDFLTRIWGSFSQKKVVGEKQKGKRIKYEPVAPEKEIRSAWGSYAIMHR